MTSTLTSEQEYELKQVSKKLKTFTETMMLEDITVFDAVSSLFDLGVNDDDIATYTPLTIEKVAQLRKMMALDAHVFAAARSGKVGLKMLRDLASSNHLWHIQTLLKDVIATKSYVTYFMFAEVVKHGEYNAGYESFGLNESLPTDSSKQFVNGWIDAFNQVIAEKEW